MKRRIILSAMVAGLLGGCAARQPVVAVAPPPVMVPAPVAVALPAGAYPGMVIPAALPDGSYPTPNRSLTAAATVWHMRAALNVAALACRGAQGSAIVTAYNAMLTTRKAALTQAEARYAAEYRSGGRDWQDRYDDAMTRLYNFFSQSPARDAFCSAAARVLAEQAGISAAAMPAFAAARLTDLERPFTDFYRAYDTWRASTQPQWTQRPVIALAGSPPIQTTTPPPVPTRIVPRLELDPSVFAGN